MQYSRRTFLTTTAGVAAFGCSPPDQDEPMDDSPAPEAAMQLSLSVRVAESFFDKRNSTMTIDELIAMASEFGYSALCMRASQVGTHTPAEEVAAVKEKIDVAGLKVSMVTGDFAVPSNNEEGPMLLRNITPYLDLADTLGSSLIRVCMKKDEDIPFAQASADEAAERNIRLAHQSHCASLFETVDGSVRVLEAITARTSASSTSLRTVHRSRGYGIASIRRLQPYLSTSTSRITA